MSKLWYYSQVQSNTWSMIFHFRGNSHMELLLVLSSWTSNTVTLFQAGWAAEAKAHFQAPSLGPKPLDWTQVGLDKVLSCDEFLLWDIMETNYLSQEHCPSESLKLLSTFKEKLWDLHLFLSMVLWPPNKAKSLKWHLWNAINFTTSICSPDPCKSTLSFSYL